jgi:hypothetical protein
MRKKFLNNIDAEEQAIKTLIGLITLLIESLTSY